MITDGDWSIEVNEQNWILLASKRYDGNTLNTEDFNSDLKRVKYLKRHFNRFKKDEDIKFRLALNHLVIFYNVFGVELATKILFLKLSDYLTLLRPLLEQLGYWPVSRQVKVGKILVNTDEIAVDQNMVVMLKHELECVLG